MAEPNGSSQYVTGNPRVDEAMNRLRARMDERFQVLEDTLTVQAFLEQKASERIKEHAQFIAEHAQFIARHENMMAQFDDKLNAVIGTLEQFREALKDLGGTRG